MRDLHLLRLFRPKSRPAGSLVLLVLCAGLLTVGAVFFVWQRYQFVRLGFTVSELRAQKAVLEAGIEPLEIEVDYLSRLERIDTLARALGMRPPGARQVRQVKDHDAARLSSR